MQVDFGATSSPIFRADPSIEISGTLEFGSAGVPAAGLGVAGADSRLVSDPDDPQAVRSVAAASAMKVATYGVRPVPVEVPDMARSWHGRDGSWRPVVNSTVRTTRRRRGLLSSPHLASVPPLVFKPESNPMTSTPGAPPDPHYRRTTRVTCCYSASVGSTRRRRVRRQRGCLAQPSTRQ